MGRYADRKVIHIDMDAFFASVEQRDQPPLRGRPVAVGRAERRGVVAAASYEARVFGVRSAMPSTVALQKCPALIFVPPRFEAYRAASQKIREIFADYTNLIEPLSLDEAYLDVTENIRGLPTAWLTAKEIRQRIFQATGLTASAGVSYNKFLAKLASDYKKPNGQFAITPQMGAHWVESLPVKTFHGIGPVTARKMEQLGILTGADLRACPLARLVQWFGKSGAWYYEIARGIDNRPVVPDRVRKSVGSETTFREDLTNPLRIEAGIEEMVNEVWAWCEKTSTRGRTVTTKVKWQDFQISTRSRTVASEIVDKAVLLEHSLALMRSLYPLRSGVRLVGVSVSHLGKAGENTQACLDFEAHTPRAIHKAG